MSTARYRDPVPSTRIVVIRHGQSTWNAVRSMAGPRRRPLTDLGRAQAAPPSRRRCRRSTPSGRATSNGPRRRPTSSPPHLDLPVRVDARLRERNAGAWTGLTRAEIEADWPHYLARSPTPGRVRARRRSPRPRYSRRWATCTPTTPAATCSSSATAGCCGRWSAIAVTVDRAFANLGGRRFRAGRRRRDLTVAARGRLFLLGTARPPSPLACPDSCEARPRPARRQVVPLPCPGLDAPPAAVDGRPAPDRRSTRWAALAAPPTPEETATASTVTVIRSARRTRTSSARLVGGHLGDPAAGVDVRGGGGPLGGGVDPALRPPGDDRGPHRPHRARRRRSPAATTFPSRRRSAGSTGCEPGGEAARRLDGHHPAVVGARPVPRLGHRLRDRPRAGPPARGRPHAGVLAPGGAATHGPSGPAATCMAKSGGEDEGWYGAGGRTVTMCPPHVPPPASVSPGSDW